MIRAAYYAVLTALAAAAVRYALVWLLPFLLAAAEAAMLEPLVLRIRRRTHFRRTFLAAVYTLLLSGALCALAAVLATQLLAQAQQLLTQLPALLASLPALAERYSARLEAMTAACPDAMRQELYDFLEQLVPRLSQLGGAASAAGARLVAQLASTVPEVGLFLITTLLATFFTISIYPVLTAFFRRQFTPEQLEKIRQIRRSVFSSLGKWLRAQSVLLTVTFCELLCGFLLLRQSYALLLAALIALIDALPVFGTGTVLLPWAAILCLLGGIPRALALLAIYAVITVVRSVLEPKLMAAQSGVPPLASLAAMYAGFRALGVGGMVLCPIALLLIKQLHDAGTLRLWK